MAREATRIGRGLLALLLGTVAPLSRALAQALGSVSASNPAATGTPPGGTSRTLNLGASVVRNERVATSAEGSLQVLFTDRTTLSLGRNSSLVIDEYVFNPREGSGALALSVTKGVLRFVGGQISHTTGASVATPVATIGIRGGTGTIMLVPGRGWLIQNQFGQLTVTNNVSRVLITRAGYGVYVSSRNEPIGDPFPLTSDMLAQSIAILGSVRGQHGGATRLPTDLLLARLGLGSNRTGRELLPGAGPGPFGILSTFGAADSLGRNRAQTRQAQEGQRILQQRAAQQVSGTTSTSGTSGTTSTSGTTTSGTSGTTTVGTSGRAGSGTGGSGTAGSGTAGSGTAGSGTAGSGTGGSGTGTSGFGGSGMGGSGTGGSGTGGSGTGGSGTI